MVAGLLLGHARTLAWCEAQGIHAAVRELGDAQAWDALAAVFTDYFKGDGSWMATLAERRRTIAAQLPPNRHEWDAGTEPRTASTFCGITARTLILRGSLTRRVILAYLHRWAGPRAERQARWLATSATSVLTVSEGPRMGYGSPRAG
jgi:hypothetical protein